MCYDHGPAYAGAGLFLGIGIANAALIDVGRLKVDFVGPAVTDDTDLGTYATLPQTITYLGTFQLRIVDTGFSVSNLAVAGIGFPPNVTASALKVTTLGSRRIQLVQATTRNNFDLLPGGLTFGDNFFEVSLLNSIISPSGTINFDVSVLPGDDGTPIPLSASPPLLASGLVALAYIRFASGRGQVQ